MPGKIEVNTVGGNNPNHCYLIGQGNLESRLLAAGMLVSIPAAVQGKAAVGAACRGVTSQMGMCIRLHQSCTCADVSISVHLWHGVTQVEWELFREHHHKPEVGGNGSLREG